MADLSHLPTDTSGEPCRFLNHYRCDACDEEWSDRWSCACDDDCPSCGASISPHDYDEEDDETDWDVPGFDPGIEPDHVACDCCGRVEHIDLLDAKPDDPDNPEGCDWNRLECIACYGPGWCPAVLPDSFTLSIRDDLAGLYRGWRIRQRWRGWRGDVRAFLRRIMRRAHA